MLARLFRQPSVARAPGDRHDGRLVHLDGLNLSRAWMLLEISATLPSGDSRCEALAHCATQHGTAGLDALKDQEYAGTHWLGTFAMYLLDIRRIRGASLGKGTL